PPVATPSLHDALPICTYDMLQVADHLSRMTPQLLSVEAWGGATYDVAMRFLSEDPWIRLAALREALPNLPIQMLLRGRNTVGYTDRKSTRLNSSHVKI